MLFVVVFLGVGIAVWVFAGKMLLSVRRQRRTAALMRETETTRAAEVSGLAAGTAVEVTGLLRLEEPVESEMAGQYCACYKSQVIREYEVSDHDSDGPSTRRRRSEVTASHERFAPFAVEEDSGAVGTRGEGAEVDATEVTNRFEPYTGSEDGFELGGLTVRSGGKPRTLGYRYVESVLSPGTRVHVIGVVGTDGQIGAPGAPEGEKRFLISHRSGEEVGGKFQSNAILLGCIAVGLLLFGAVFVTIGAVLGFAYLSSALSAAFPGAVAQTIFLGA
jgi:hypothetical protein